MRSLLIFWLIMPLSQACAAPPLNPAIEFLPLTPKRQVLCLALAIYKEARSDNEFAQSLVAKTIIHRSNKNNISECAVLAIPHQFPWITKIPKRWSPMEQLAWQKAQYVAFMSKYSSKYPEPACQTQYFNTILISTHQRNLKCAIRSGHQIFYDLRK